MTKVDYKEYIQREKDAYPFIEIMNNRSLPIEERARANKARMKVLYDHEYSLDRSIEKIKERDTQEFNRLIADYRQELIDAGWMPPEDGSVWRDG